MRIHILYVTCIILVSLFGTLTSPSSAAADIQPKPRNANDIIELYGHEIAFDVFRNESKIGEHRVKLEKKDNRLLIRSTLNLEIKLLFFSAFSYSYASEATWTDGQLDQITTTVDDDGDVFQMNATRTGERMQVAYTGGRYVTEAPVYPTNHWNAHVLGQQRVLNTLTGLINNVTISAGQVDMITTEKGTIPARHYVYSGDLENEVWYDRSGRWVKMRFNGRDGVPVTYKCRSCQGSTAKRVTN